VKHLFDGEDTADSIKEFVAKYYRGELANYIVSEEIPKEETGSCIKLVYRNYNDVVRKSGKDSFVYFHMPNAQGVIGHQDEQKFLEIMEETGRKLKWNKHVNIAIFNILENQIMNEGLDLKKPFKLFLASDLKNPIDYEGAPNSKSFIEIIKEKTTYALSFSIIEDSPGREKTVRSIGTISDSNKRLGLCSLADMNI